MPSPAPTPDSSTELDGLRSDPSSFRVGEWWVEPDLLRVRRGEESRKLEPMAMRLLVFLAERPDELVSRAEILEKVWEGRSVVDETLSRAVSLVRQALGDDAQDPRYIETVPKRGYRLMASVERGSSEKHSSAAGPAPSSLPPALKLGRGRLVLLASVLLALAALWFLASGDRPESRTEAPTPAASSERPGIVVLPFKNLSPDPANAYLAEGLTEELIHQLAGVGGLRVVSRTSSMTFRDSDATAPEIAETLGVDFLLEGTVLVVDQRLRITAQLIRPDQDEHLLSRSYDRDFSEVLDLQREVAQDVVEQTRIQLSPAEVTRLARDRPIDTAAYRSFLQGQQVVQQRSELGRGLDLLSRAVELDPAFAPAWAALADANLLSVAYLGRPEDSSYQAAESAIRRALELDPELAPAYASQGLLRFQQDRDWAASEASYRRALELEPSYVTARQWYSEFLSLLGRHQEALRQIEVALELDPLSPLIHAVAGQRSNAAGRYPEALSHLEDAEVLGGDFRWIIREKAWALRRLGRDQEAFDLLVEEFVHRARAREVGDGLYPRFEQEAPEESWQQFFGRRLEILLSQKQRSGHATWVAEAYAGAGRAEEALQWLAQAVPERNLWLMHFLKSPAFDGLRDDPRFIESLGDIPPWRPVPAEFQ